MPLPGWLLKRPESGVFSRLNRAVMEDYEAELSMLDSLQKKGDLIEAKAAFDMDGTLYSSEPIIARYAESNRV